MHSASDIDLTPDIRPGRREIGLWDVARFLAGVIAGVIFLIGVVRLIILGEDPHETPMTQSEAAQLSIAIVMTICGLVVSWLSFAAQRAADRRAEQRAELTVVVARVAVNATRLDELAAEVHTLVAEEQEQRQHSTKARADVAKIQTDLTDLRVGVAEMAQRMPAEQTLLATLKAYIDAMFATFREHEDDAVKEAKTGRYMDEVRGRLNGQRTRLHAVDDTV